MTKNLLLENIKLAINSVRGQQLRTWLTALIISFGIMALVGILSATDAIKQSLAGNFSTLGANTFSIRSNSAGFRIGRSGVKPKFFKYISFAEAQNFKARFNYAGSIVSVSQVVSGTAEIKHQAIKTDPNVQVWGIDENHLITAGYEIETGRNFTVTDINEGRSVAIIGQDLVSKLYKNTDPIGKNLTYRGKRFLIIGILTSKGSSNIFSGDRVVFIPITYAKSNFNSANTSYTLNVMASGAELLDATEGESISMIRAVRKLKPKEDDNFIIQRSDGLAKTLIDNLSMVSTGAFIIGIIALFSAAIALMNIMLVSVTERTREIGTMKAIGATKSSVLSQFLMEAILICQLGGVIGVLLGIAIGNWVATLVGGTFFVPWLWIIVALIICIIVGIVAGIFPAVKAAKLDPIEALRYE